MPADNKTEEFLRKLTPCIERGDLEACVDKAARLAHESGISAAELVDLSEQMGEGGKYDFAYALALAAVQGLEGEYKAEAYYNAGVAARFIGKSKESGEHYKKAIEVDPKDADAHNNYAALLAELDRKSEAEEHYKKAIEINPKDAEAHNNHAFLLIELDRKSEAEEHYKKAIEINPKYAGAHYNYANLLAELDRKSEAEEHYRKAIEIDPKDAVMHHNYAFLLMELDRESEAEEHYKKAIEINPKDAGAHNNYANLLRKKAQFYEAEKEVRIALQIEPENPYALGTLGDILADEDYLEEAIKEYQAALKNSSSMVHSAASEVRNNLGWVYAQLKQYNKAKEEFKKALVLDPMNVKAIRNLRALGKVESMPEISKTQICLVAVPLLFLFVLCYLFWIGKLSETMFAIQSTILIALSIFIVLYHHFARFKVGPIEFEKSTESRLIEAKSRSMEAISKMER